jgi:hypothetical protein
MIRTVLAMTGALVALTGTTLIATEAHARTEVLRWGHADPVGEGVQGFRLRVKPLGGSWATTDYAIGGLGSPAANEYSLNHDVTDQAIVSFQVQAYGDGISSGWSTEITRYPDSTTAEPGGSFLLDSNFANAGEEPEGWIDTKPYNSMAQDSSLFGPGVVEGDGVFMTSSGEVNIHSHHEMNDPTKWVNYEYRGRMRTNSADASLGFTGYSMYPEEDSYYRIRAESGSTFYMAPHPDGVFSMSCTSTDTGVVLTANQWFHFKMRLQSEAAHTAIVAKVWREDQSEPAGWQIDCVHGEASRLAYGTVGVWSMGVGQKYWDDLQVEVLGEAPTEPDPPPVEPTPPDTPTLLQD